MPDLNFEIISGTVRPYAAVPTLVFKLEITNATAHEEVYAAALKCQVLIDATKRQYDAESKENLQEVFGEPKRWEETVKGLFWTTVTVPVARFEGKTVVDISIGCYEDHISAAGKYFYSVRDGEIPLAFLFSGTLFYKNENSALQITQVPWSKEAAFKMPASLWQNMMDTYFPNVRWLQVGKDIYEKLYKYKALHSYVDFDDCINDLVERAKTETQASLNNSYGSAKR